MANLASKNFSILPYFGFLFLFNLPWVQLVCRGRVDKVVVIPTQNGNLGHEATRLDLAIVYTCIYNREMLLFEITDAFARHKLKYAIVGGYAMALHGLVRATMDVDFVLNLTLSDFELAEKVLREIGMQSRLPIRAPDVIKMRKEYIEARNLVAWSFVDYKDPTRQVDILIKLGLADIETEKISVGGRKLVVATLKEILKMKIEAGRPQDLVDVKNIRDRLNEEK